MGQRECLDGPYELGLLVKRRKRGTQQGITWMIVKIEIRRKRSQTSPNAMEKPAGVVPTMMLSQIAQTSGVLSGKMSAQPTPASRFWLSNLQVARLGSVEGLVGV